MKLSEAQRKELLKTMSEHVLGGMDYKSLEMFAYEQLYLYHSDLSDDELIEEVENYFDAKIDDII